MSSDEIDYPEIGQRRRGMVLVCRGDDQPENFADWLQPLVVEFERLSGVAAEFGVNLDAQDGSTPIEDVTEFCERLGVQFNRKYWEGSLASGYYYFGWIKSGTLRSAISRGKALLNALESHLDSTVRLEIMHELQGIKELDDFIERTADDRQMLRKKIESLNSSVQSMKAALDETTERLSRVAKNDSSDIDRACILLASALLSGKACKVIAGPLVLWNDGVVYAIVDWGGKPIPKASSPAVLLDGILRSRRRVVRVSEATVIGGWLSGPIYRKGPEDISGWSDVWKLQENRERKFVVDPPEYAEQVQKIHFALVSGND